MISLSLSMKPIFPSLISGSLFLLAFISVSNPRKANVAANRWMSFLFFATACALASSVVTVDKTTRLLEFTRFAMAPALYLSVLYFTSPDKNSKLSSCFISYHYYCSQYSRWVISYLNLLKTTLNNSFYVQLTSIRGFLYLDQLWSRLLLTGYCRGYDSFNIETT